MFRGILGSIILALFMLIPSQVFAFDDWQITSFVSDITVNKDGSMTVIETIEADFFEEKRGIFREIPYEYYDNLRQADRIDLTVVSVKNEVGEDWEYKTTFDYGYLNIRIGNPDIYLTGPQVYEITYEVDGAIAFYDEHQELYWDVTGNDWFVPILSSTAFVTLPAGNEIELETRCFTGAFGSVDELCTNDAMGASAAFTAQDFLTIVVGWPKGIVDEPTQVEKFFGWLKNNWAFSLPVFTFFIMLGLWNRYGKDPQDPPGLVVQYDPPADLTPAEVGYLVSQSLRTRYLPAELVNLASKGYIEIEEKLGKKSKEVDDYILRKVKEPDADLKEHEKLILKGIFLSKKERKLSNIPTSFYHKVADIKKQIYKQLKEKKYFHRDPQVVRNGWLGIAIAIGCMAFIFVGARHVHYFAGILLSGVVVFCFSFIMSRRTQKGVLALEHALGFEEYMNVAEDRRVKWEEEQNLFFQYLPYAMVFNMADKWSNAFKGLFNDIPEWYKGDLNTMNAYDFTRNMHLFTRTTTSNIRPPQSTSSSGSYRSSSSSFSSGSSGFSSGGGFSGGGFGGGGGGSW